MEQCGRCFITLLKLVFSRVRILERKSYRKVYFICSSYYFFNRTSKLQYLLIVSSVRLFISSIL